MHFSRSDCNQALRNFSHSFYLCPLLPLLALSKLGGYGAVNQRRQGCGLLSKQGKPLFPPPAMCLGSTQQGLKQKKIYHLRFVSVQAWATVVLLFFLFGLAVIGLSSNDDFSPSPTTVTHHQPTFRPQQTSHLSSHLPAYRKRFEDIEGKHRHYDHHQPAKHYRQQEGDLYEYDQGEKGELHGAGFSLKHYERQGEGVEEPFNQHFSQQSGQLGTNTAPSAAKANNNPHRKHFRHVHRGELGARIFPY